MAGMPSSYIDPSILKDAQAIDENKLIVPDGADVVGIAGEKGYRASWSETFDITKVETKESQKKNGWWVTTIQFTVAPDVDSINAASPAWQRIMTFPSAGGQKNHDYYGLHMKALAKMANLLRATGLLAEGDGFNPADYFDNAETPLLAKRVNGTVTQYVKRNGDEEQDIGHFTPAV